MKYILLVILFSVAFLYSCRQTRTVQIFPHKDITVDSLSAPESRKERIHVGAERTRQYFNKLKHDRKIGIVANQTSLVNQTHLVDTLLSSGIQVLKVFTPEHGFRGVADAGAVVNNDIDAKTGLPIISLYGNRKKPSASDLEGIDIMVIDLQDVGTRFYTYISTMTLVMEACAEHNIPVIILDRPNPNGFFVDGPVLEKGFESFVGMHPVPVVHGMTMAEYAHMVNEEGWLSNGIKCDLDWVECSGYKHDSYYQLPVRPSPNLPNMNAILLYPSLCFFEGTKVSVGRGTDYPFQVAGYPGFGKGIFSFTPVSRPGALNPPYKNQSCDGFNLSDSAVKMIESPGLRLHWLIDFYKADSVKSSFFNSYFNTLAGSSNLRTQIEKGMTEAEIRESWQPALNKFKNTRERYLLYKDFQD